MQYGMISYVVPLARFPDTYNRQPLAVVSLASQSQYMSLYLSGLYGDPKLREWFERAWAPSGKRMNMGKSCLRFKALDDLPLEVVEAAVRKVSVDDLIAMHEAAHAGKRPRSRPATKKQKKTATPRKKATSRRAAERRLAPRRAGSAL